MKKILDIITAKMEKAFTDAGYEASFGRVTVSNRPDLCEYQCNGALSAAKQYKCAPIAIANAVAEKLDAADFSMIEAVMPGFINLKLSDTFLQNYLEQMRTEEGFGIEKIGNVLIDIVEYKKNREHQQQNRILYKKFDQDVGVQTPQRKPSARQMISGIGRGAVGVCHNVLSS